MVYDPVKDKFLGQQPFASWSLDSNDDWQAPIAHPTDTDGKYITWDEAGQKWTAKVSRFLYRSKLNCGFAAQRCGRNLRETRRI